MGSRTRRHHHPRHTGRAGEHRRAPRNVLRPSPHRARPWHPQPERTLREPARPHSHPRAHQADTSRTRPLQAPCRNLELQPKNSDNTRTVSSPERGLTPARSKPRPLGQGSVRLSQSGRMSPGSWLSPSEAASIMNSEEAANPSSCGRPAKPCEPPTIPTKGTPPLPLNLERGEPSVDPRGDRGCGRRLGTHRPAEDHLDKILVTRHRHVRDNK